MDTKEKEKIGEQLLRKEHLIDYFFPENIGHKKISTKKLQLAGVDYEVYLPNNEIVYIDLKVCIGSDYSMKAKDYVAPTRVSGRRTAIPLEIYQNGIFTNTKGKLTDYFLYIVIDDYGKSIWLVPYEKVRDICLKHRKTATYENGILKTKWNGTQTVYTSFNGTGQYIKVGAYSISEKSKILGSENENHNEPTL